MNLDTLSRNLKNLIADYAETAIAYNFSLDGTITNNVDTGVLNITDGLVASGSPSLDSKAGSIRRERISLALQYQIRL